MCWLLTDTNNLHWRRIFFFIYVVSFQKNLHLFSLDVLETLKTSPVSCIFSLYLFDHLNQKKVLLVPITENSRTCQLVGGNDLKLKLCPQNQALSTYLLTLILCKFQSQDPPSVKFFASSSESVFLGKYNGMRFFFPQSLKILKGNNCHSHF